MRLAFPGETGFTLFGENECSYWNFNSRCDWRDASSSFFFFRCSLCLSMKLDFLLSGPLFLIWWRTTACSFRAFCTLRCFSPALMFGCWEPEKMLLSSLFYRIIDELSRWFSSFALTKEQNFKSVSIWLWLIAIKFLFSAWDWGLFTMLRLSKLERSKKSLFS